MVIRLIALRDCDDLVNCQRELGTRGWGYILFDGHRRVLLAAQSVAKLAHVVQQLIRAPGSNFDPDLDGVWPQGLYSLLGGAIQKRYHKTWRCEKLELKHLPQRFAELKSDGYRQVGIVAGSESNWTIGHGS